MLPKYKIKSEIMYLFVIRQDTILRSNLDLLFHFHIFYLLGGSLRGFINLLSGSHHYYILHHGHLHTRFFPIPIMAHILLNKLARHK